MGQIFLDQTSTWAGGLFTSAEPDRIPENSFPFAKNNALYSTADGQAIPGTRAGSALAVGWLSRSSSNENTGPPNCSLVTRLQGIWISLRLTTTSSGG